MFTSKIASTCSECGAEIETRGTWYNQLCMRELDNLAFMQHRKKIHGQKYKVSLYGAIWSKLLLHTFLQFVLFFIWLITLPLWALHELCTFW